MEKGKRKASLSSRNALSYAILQPCNVAFTFQSRPINSWLVFDTRTSHFCGTEQPSKHISRSFSFVFQPFDAVPPAYIRFLPFSRGSLSLSARKHRRRPASSLLSDQRRAVREPARGRVTSGIKGNKRPRNERGSFELGNESAGPALIKRRGKKEARRSLRLD